MNTKNMTVTIPMNEWLEIQEQLKVVNKPNAKELQFLEQVPVKAIKSVLERFDYLKDQLDPNRIGPDTQSTCIYIWLRDRVEGRIKAIRQSVEIPETVSEAKPESRVDAAMKAVPISSIQNAPVLF